MQDVESTAPGVARYVPAKQLRQADDLVTGWYRPAGHGLQALAPAEEKVPAAQAVHTVAK